MKKKFFAVFFALLVLCTAVVPVFADEADDWDFSEEYPTAEPTGVTINVYNWGEYISNGTEGSLDVNAEFTRRTGIEVNYTTFDSNESLYSKLAGGGASYDVIVPSDYMISKLMNENMLAELDFSNIPNFEYIDEQFRNPDYDPETNSPCRTHGAPSACSIIPIMSPSPSPAGLFCGTSSTAARF